MCDKDFDWFTLLLTSTLISTIISSVIAFLTQKWALNSAFKNDYYKLITAKRLETYETLTGIIGQLDILGLDYGNQKYQAVFYGISRFDKFMVELSAISLKSIHLTKELSEKLTEFNSFLIRKIDPIYPDELEARYGTQKQSDQEILEYLISLYPEIATFRSEMKQLISRDMRTLYDVDRHFKDLSS